MALLCKNLNQLTAPRFHEAAVVITDTGFSPFKSPKGGLGNRLTIPRFDKAAVIIEDIECGLSRGPMQIWAIDQSYPVPTIADTGYSLFDGLRQISESTNRFAFLSALRPLRQLLMAGIDVLCSLQTFTHDIRPVKSASL